MKKRSWKFVISVSVLFLMFLCISPTFAQVPLDPTSIPKYETPLFVPPTMPITSVLPGGIDYYEIAVQQFQQQILPAGPPNNFPMTTVWSYGAVNTPASLHYPTYTIEANVNRRVRIKWINGLVDQAGNYLPHLFSADVDQTLHWANPPQDCLVPPARTDCEGTSGDPYLGPVPIVTHLHGSHVTPESDGFPEAWYLPAANNLAGFAPQGSDFGQIAAVPVVEVGAAVFQYRNDQRATTLWFHDHSLGITRLNIYAGPAGFYLLRGGDSDLPQARNPSVLPVDVYEIPMVIQERSFLDNGSLNFASPAGDGDGDTIVVNGNTWPFLNVEPRRYRFRFLNASNNNPIDLVLATDNTPGDSSIDDGAWTEVANAFWQIGADGGFLPAPANVTNVILHIAERADVIVDFSTYTPGTVLYLVNDGGDTGTTEQVMRFVVVALTSADTSTPADQLVLPAFTPLGPADFTRQVSVNDGVGGPGKLLGTVNPGPPATGIPLRWEAATTETPVFNTTEIWEIFNFDGGDHPIHLHMVQFEILDRTPIGDVIGGPTTTGPGPGETGTKDTVFVDGLMVTRVKAKFDIPGMFVWHCHILDHEDDEMMRPYEVGVVEPLVLVTPNTAGLVIPAGSAYTISWGAAPTAASFKIQYSFDNGATWKLIANNVLENSYPWSVPTFNKNFKTALIRVTAYDAGGTFLANVVSIPFTIEVLKLESPDGGEIFTGGDNVVITWTTNVTTKNVAKVSLAFRRQGSTTWRHIKTLTGNPGTYDWTLPAPPEDRQYKVRVTLKKANGDVIVRDLSDAPFTINGPPLVAGP